MFDALDRKVLATMRITIFVDKPSPTNIVEAYTYHFKYLVGTGDLPRKLTGMEVSSSSGEALAVADVQQGVIDIVRRLVLVDQTLPALPGVNLLAILWGSRTDMLFARKSLLDHTAVLYRRLSSQL